MSSLLKKALPAVAAIAMPYAAPWLGAALLPAATAATQAGVGGALIGAGSGALSGGGLKGALLGGAGGGLGSAVSAGGTLGGVAKGLSSTQQGLVGGALTGAGMGGATGGAQGALLGAATGGAGGYYNAGGFDNTLSSLGLGGSGAGELTSSQVNTLNAVKPGNYASAPVSLGGAGTSTGSGGSLFNANSLGTVLSAVGQNDANEEAAKALREAQGRVEGVLAPYNQTGQAVNAQLANELQSGQLGGTFDPGDLTQDPGYQFQQEQGQAALERSLASQGMGQSGAAVKAATEYNQGLASQTYQDAYNRWLQSQGQRYNMLSGQSGQGLRAASALGGAYDTMGDISANRSVGQSNILTGALSSLLSGSGALKIVGYDQNNNPIYARG